MRDRQAGAGAWAICVYSFTPFLSQWSPVTPCTLLSVYPENPNSQDAPGCPVPQAILRFLPLTELTLGSLEMAALNDKGKRHQTSSSLENS